MKTILKLKFIAVIGLTFFILSSEEGCKDTRDNSDLYGPEDEINQGWEDEFGSSTASIIFCNKNETS